LPLAPTSLGLSKPPSGPVLGGVNPNEPLESIFDADDFDAAVRSTSTIVSGSPTRRARVPS